MDKKTKPRDGRWWMFGGWQIALAGFLLGVVDTIGAVMWGLEFRRGDQDETLLVGAFISLSFALFGHLLGLTLRARRRERLASQKLSGNLQRIASIQARLAQTEKLATLGQMASILAHEVRNPLAIVRSMLQNLAEVPSAPPNEIQATCEQAIDEIDRLTRVTGSLLRFARPLALQRRPVEARDIVERVRLLARNLPQDKLVELVVEEEAASALLDVDPDLLCQVLLGLLYNAAEAAAQSGVIVLECRHALDGVEFAVLDNGPGFPEELRERIFEPFFTTRPDGNGLGLPVARQILEAHGASIQAENRKTGGARFSFRLSARERVERAV